MRTSAYIEPNTDKQFLKTTYFYSDGTSQTSHTRLDNVVSGGDYDLWTNWVPVSETPQPLYLYSSFNDSVVEITPEMVVGGYVDFSTVGYYYIDVYYQGRFNEFEIIV